MKIDRWKYFSNKDFPEEGQEVTIIWSNGGETDCIWVSEGMEWNCEIIPVSWKPLELQDDSNIPEDFGTHQYHDIG